MGGAEVETRPVGSQDLADLARLFEAERNTRRCWCTAFCVSRTQFALGWLTRGNRARFEELAVAEGTPMGVLASVAGEPVGWCACGPRSRYAAAGRNGALRGRSPDEDGRVWLLACLFVHSDYRGQGITSALVRAAVELARGRGALAIEGWPTTQPDRRSADGFLGREKTFADLGFRCVERPVADRAIMRLELNVT